MIRSLRARLTITFVGLMVLMIAAVWGVNRWYLEGYYVSQKVMSLKEAYEAIDGQIAENEDNGVSVEEAMKREQDSEGNITEGNLQRLVRNFSETANVSMLMIDNSAAETAIYSTARDERFLKDRMDRYIFGKSRVKTEILEECGNYKIQKTFDLWREGMYLESWGFFSDNSTAFIMSTPLSSIGESVALSNRFLTYVGFSIIGAGAIAVYLITKRMTKPIHQLSDLSEKMSQLDFEAKYEMNEHEVEEIKTLGSSMNTLSERLKEAIGDLKSANNQLQKDIEEKTKIDEIGRAHV